MMFHTILCRGTIALLILFGAAVGLRAETDPGEARWIGAYDFPFVNPLVATVVGTPQDYQAKDLPALQVGRNVSLGHVRPIPDRVVPQVLWFERRGLNYGLVRQPQRKAPVVFIIAGTGAGFSADKNQLLARVLYRAGFHVIAIASPTFSNFIINASGTSVPGRMKDDARDIYVAMQAVLDDVGSRIEPAGFSLTGYSLGGINAAFVAELDSREGVFDFDKVLMINSPVSLFNSVNHLDAMLDNHLRQGSDDVVRFLQQLLSEFGNLRAQGGDLDLSGDFLYRAFSALELRNRELEILIGLSFRFSSANLSFVSDIMTESGFLVPQGVTLTATSSLTGYLRETLQQNFMAYIQNIYLPYFQRTEPDYTLARAMNEESLHAIEGYLRTAPNLGLMHNADDIIMKPGEVEWLAEVMGRRATIFPTGGHCGNMAQHEFVDILTEFFAE